MSMSTWTRTPILDFTYTFVFIFVKTIFLLLIFFSGGKCTNECINDQLHVFRPWTALTRFTDEFLRVTHGASGLRVHPTNMEISKIEIRKLTDVTEQRINLRPRSRWRSSTRILNVPMNTDKSIPFDTFLSRWKPESVSILSCSCWTARRKFNPFSDNNRKILMTWRREEEVSRHV